MFEDENVPLAQNSEEGLDIQKPSLQSKFQTVLVKVIIPVLIFFILLILFAATVTLIAFVIFGDNIKAQSEYNVFVVGDWVCFLVNNFRVLVPLNRRMLPKRWMNKLKEKRWILSFQQVTISTGLVLIIQLILYGKNITNKFIIPKKI